MFSTAKQIDQEHIFRLIDEEVRIFEYQARVIHAGDATNIKRRDYSDSDIEFSEYRREMQITIFVTRDPSHVQNKVKRIVETEALPVSQEINLLSQAGFLDHEIDKILKTKHSNYESLI